MISWISRRASLLTILWFVSACTTTIRGDQQWMNWRGELGNGNAGNGVYPIRWSEKENVLWKVPLHGRGGSTPIVVGERILLTSGIDGQNALLAFDKQGRNLWQTNLGAERAGKHKKGSGSNSSPVSDGKFVYAYFKSGDLACCSLDGEVIWKRNIQMEFGEDTLYWDLGTSPVLTKEAVVIAVMQTGPSFLVAFDKASGQQLWKKDRMLNANMESNQAYTTPAILKSERGETLFALGADHVTAHDAASGKELWRVGGFNPSNAQNYRCISSPLIAGELVICPYARGQLVTAVRHKPGLKAKERVAWQREKIGADVPTPTLLGDRILLVTDKGEINCLEASSGKTIWSGELPKNRLAYSSSPIVAGNHIYLVREDGVTFVLKGGDKFEIVSENALDSPTVATPVFVDNRIYLRTFDALYCLARP